MTRAPTVPTAIITMAGFGSRFAEAGYKVPKYRIEVHDRTLFSWSMLSLKDFSDAGWHFAFVVRRADEASSFIAGEAKKLGIKSFDILQLDAPTDGQATTALAARSIIADPSAPCLIYNIDTFVHPSALPSEAPKGDGWIPCFPGAGNAWSFAAADENGRVREVREKQRISPHATAGLYWFSSFGLLEECYGQYYLSNANLEKGEKYVAPLYNGIIAKGLDVFIHEVPLSAVIPLGVPADVERFKLSEPPLVV